MSVRLRLLCSHCSLEIFRRPFSLQFLFPTMTPEWYDGTSQRAVALFGTDVENGAINKELDDDTCEVLWFSEYSVSRPDWASVLS